MLARRMLLFAPMRFLFCVGLGAIFAGCSAGGEGSEGDQTEGTLSSANIVVTPEAGGTCGEACFDVQSSKDVSFIAVDAAGCGRAAVELSLFTLDAAGNRTPIARTPEPHGNGKSCPDIPPDALKFDELSGKHLVLCTAGAATAEIFVKSGKTCTAQSFELPALPVLDVRAAFDPSGCSLTTGYETYQVAHADGSPVESYTCRWTFDDGGTTDSCSGQYTFSAPGFHSATVSVTEVGSGATGSFFVGSRPIWDELEIDVLAEAPRCGLSFSYTISKTGGKPSGGLNFLSIEPSENVVTPHDGPWPSSGTIEVSEPGVYTITAYREEETSYSLCEASDSTDVTIIGCH